MWERSPRVAYGNYRTQSPLPNRLLLLQGAVPIVPMERSPRRRRTVSDHVVAEKDDIPQGLPLCGSKRADFFIGIYVAGCRGKRAAVLEHDVPKGVAQADD